ncbi:biotin--[acetyl-CoA-carboxylase] ligase [Flagellimonas sp. DF-77]|uniref:biotin--[acetyl-CoA-carboxylase] ligase n=1 Tax=Flagellimonas algarum TaxID=3230298 RepID=UPI003399708E
MMQIIKLDATPSTNTFLKELSANQTLNDYTVVVTESQTQGRGQQGAIWQSEGGKNLTMSVLKTGVDLQASEHFLLNILVSLAVKDVLDELSVPDIKVKWPNDIMSGNRKVCGILIENVLRGEHIARSVIGIGLNVNQTAFKGLERAASVRLLTGKTHDLGMVREKLLHALKSSFKFCEKKGDETLRKHYDQALFRKGRPSTFENRNGQRFNAVILGVSNQGLLQLQTETESVVEFGFKEVKLCY